MKINHHTMQQQENQFNHDLSYMEWLMEHNPEPTPNDMNNMEKVFCKSTILKTSQHTHNNLHYQPLQGA